MHRPNADVPWSLPRRNPRIFSRRGLVSQDSAWCSSFAPLGALRALSINVVLETQRRHVACCTPQGFLCLVSQIAHRRWEFICHVLRCQISKAGQLEHSIAVLLYLSISPVSEWALHTSAMREIFKPLGFDPNPYPREALLWLALTLWDHRACMTKLKA